MKMLVAITTFSSYPDGRSFSITLQGVASVQQATIGTLTTESSQPGRPGVQNGGERNMMLACVERQLGSAWHMRAPLLTTQLPST